MYNNNGAHTHTLCGSEQDVFHIIWGMKSYLSAVTPSINPQLMCCHVVYHRMQKHKTKLLC